MDREFKQASSPNQCFVWNFNKATTQDILKDFLEEKIGVKGCVLSLRIPRGKKYAFVSFINELFVNTAIEKCNGQECDGDVIYVKNNVSKKRLSETLMVKKDWDTIQKWIENKTISMNITVNKNQSTLLHYAVEEDKIDMIEYLLSRRMNKDINDRFKRTPLHISCIHGSYKACALLLQKGAKVNVFDHLGNTPLHYASKNNRKLFIELLVRKSANLQINYPIKNKEGKTAREVFPGSGQEESHLFSNFESRLVGNRKCRIIKTEYVSMFPFAKDPNDGKIKVLLTKQVTQPEKEEIEKRVVNVDGKYFVFVLLFYIKTSVYSLKVIDSLNRIYYSKYVNEKVRNLIFNNIHNTEFMMLNPSKDVDFELLKQTDTVFSVRLRKQNITLNFSREIHWSAFGGWFKGESDMGDVRRTVARVFSESTNGCFFESVKESRDKLFQTIKYDERVIVKNTVIYNQVTNPIFLVPISYRPTNSTLVLLPSNILSLKWFSVKDEILDVMDRNSDKDFFHVFSTLKKLRMELKMMNNRLMINSAIFKEILNFSSVIDLARIRGVCRQLKEMVTSIPFDFNDHTHSKFVLNTFPIIRSLVLNFQDSLEIFLEKSNLKKSLLHKVEIMFPVKNSDISRLFTHLQKCKRIKGMKRLAITDCRDVDDFKNVEKLLVQIGGTINELELGHIRTDASSIISGLFNLKKLETLKLVSVSFEENEFGWLKSMGSLKSKEVYIESKYTQFMKKLFIAMYKNPKITSIKLCLNSYEEIRSVMQSEGLQGKEVTLVNEQLMMSGSPQEVKSKDIVMKALVENTPIQEVTPPSKPTEVIIPQMEMESSPNEIVVQENTNEERRNVVISGAGSVINTREKSLKKPAVLTQNKPTNSIKHTFQDVPMFNMVFGITFLVLLVCILVAVLYSRN